MDQPIRGANTLLVTPFTRACDLDLESLGNLTEFVLSGGVDGVMALGSSGEFFALTLAERAQVARRVVDVVNGRVPVTIGVGSDSTVGAIETARLACEAGADCVLVLPPLYFDSSPRAQVLHFTAVAASVDLPVMLYDGAGGIPVPAEVVAEVHKAAPNVRYVKQATPDPGLTRRILEAAPGVSPLAGDDTLLLTSLRNGAVGSSTAIGNIMPATVAQLHAAHARGDRDTAISLFTQLMPAVLVTSAPKVEFIARLKAALAAKGVIADSAVRSPLHELDPDSRDELLAVLRTLHIV